MPQFNPDIIPLDEYEQLHLTVGRTPGNPHLCFKERCCPARKVRTVGGLEHPLAVLARDFKRLVLGAGTGATMSAERCHVSSSCHEHKKTAKIPIEDIYICTNHMYLRSTNALREEVGEYSNMTTNKTDR
jgi:hypothetical protein